MSKILKHLIPKFLKAMLRERLREEIRMSGVIDSTLPRRIADLEEALFEIQPEIIPRSPEIMAEIPKVFQGNKIPVLNNLSISKHDYMYQFLRKHSDDAKQAYLEYIKSGAHMMEVLNKIVMHKWKDFSKLNAFLDFASGYGRLTRFMVEKMEPRRIWISDIKAGAVEFQASQFGVHGVVSTLDPEKLEINQKFDLIFVGSLFSHLPEATFERWLQRLANFLTSDGVLVFTVHDIALLPELSQLKEEMVFSNQSEETNLYGKDGRLIGTSYGTSYVSEAFVKNVIHKIDFANKHYFRFAKLMWGLQDVYIISNKANDNFSTLPF